MTIENSPLSKQDQTFLDLIFDGSQMRNPEEAKLLAGFDKSYPVLSIVKRVRDELLKKYDDYLTLYAPKGLAGLMDVLDNPETPGSKVKLQAVVELLDRSGVTKKDKAEQATIQPNYIFYLPNKSEITN